MKETPPSSIYSRECFDAGVADSAMLKSRSLRHGRALRYIGPEPGEVILDVGCGRGEIVEQCLEAGATALGIDYSQAAVEIARDRIDRGVIARASATHLPFKNSAFDKVSLLDVLEHLGKDDAADCIREVRRVLRPEGTFVVHTPNRYEKVLSLPRRLNDLILNKSVVRADAVHYIGLGHVNVQGPASLRRVLAREGFTGRIVFNVPEAGAMWKRTIYGMLFFACSLWAICRTKVGPGNEECLE